VARALGEITVDAEVRHDGNGHTLTWSIANTGAAPVAIDAVRYEWTATCGDSVRWFTNGYQSWSPTGARTLGADRDPSQHPASFRFIRAVHHADPSVAPEGELRSEMVTVVDLGRGGGLRCIGFDGGAHHSGTIRARRSPTDVTFAVEAWFGGAELAPGVRRELHAVHVTNGDDAPSLLDAWAARAGACEAARVNAPFHVGWCSWYYYFHGITQRALFDNLALAADWPFTVF